MWTHDLRSSAFLFGSRGTGKSSLLRNAFPHVAYLDLLKPELQRRLLSNPERLTDYLPPHCQQVIIDEIQKAPALLDEVHRLIETLGVRFILTGSSARKLRASGVNLLAGRARTHYLHPFVSTELADRFDLAHALRYGMLPSAWVDPDPQAYLDSYVTTYLKEEVQQEGLTRNVGNFARFLESASFSQGAVLNISQVARQAAVERKVVEGYFEITEDLLLAIRLPVFRRRAKRDVTAHPKFYFFDAGVFRAIRPKGPLDNPTEIDGPALETLVLQHLRAWNDYAGRPFDLSFWRTRTGLEVDFILYGESGLIAIECKRSRTIHNKDLRSLREFRSDYPMARAILLYAGRDRLHREGVDIVPFDTFFDADFPHSLGFT